ncbi:MAG: DNA polymerase III subunit beta [Acidimicrobiaceae bacterium]|nr:DNA polymerase III subunit beta [Acidimicrobiaceae bacterium]MCY4175121.1 DNA polymerase III subunit beta [Acidimicrobiaceae bacterium]MCY4279322.1 DNA polymerase III subunit beta [Acidimicrobiaceae bacterium]MCY4294531.1 DNA polymerase III subunit beta [Acidimicrobiaceae bacterium]
MGLKFRCERDSLHGALTAALRATAGPSANRAALAGVRLELAGDQLTVTGSDLDLTLSVTTEVSGESDGVAITPRLIAELVRNAPVGAVDFSVADGEAEFVAGTWKNSIRLISEDDYPQLPSMDEASPSVVFTGAEFRDALSQVVRSASSDDSRPILTGVLMATEAEGGLRLVSTDSYRLSVRDIDGSSLAGDYQKVLVPGRALSELQRQISDSTEVKLQLAEQNAQFTVGEMCLSTRLIPGDFPNYQGLIPSDHPNCLTADREQLLEAVKRVRLLAQDATPIRLVMSGGSLEVIAITHDVGKSEQSLEADYKGEDLTVAFNHAYLIDGLEAVVGDEVTLETADAVKPAVLRSVGDDSFLYLLMPVRVS